ncbi:MAG TPA: hypothetical protein VM368_03890 [Flavisolibacter sp.]|nr:hypothetical protein [Flavisolibacter sp.]
MKSYLLLRDNSESGPYTLQELKKQNLHVLDLIWIEGESTSWAYPTEIPELKDTGNLNRKKPLVVAKKNSSYTSTVSNSALPNTKAFQPTVNTGATTTASLYEYDDAAKELFSEVKYVKKTRRNLTIDSNIMGLFLLVIGVMMASFVLKNIVQTFDDNQVASAQATEIQSATYASNHSAKGPEVTIVTNNELPVRDSQLIVDTDLSLNNNVVKQKNIADQTEAQIIPAVEATNPEAIAPVTEIITEEKEEKIEAPVKKKVVNIESMLQVSTNEYKVGLLGGISNLEIEVVNNSPATLSKAVIQVDYLKPNGSVLKSEYVQVNNVAPGKSKKTNVPASSRGTKVSYKIIEANASEGGLELSST